MKKFFASLSFLLHSQINSVDSQIQFIEELQTFDFELSKINNMIENLKLDSEKLLSN